MKDFSIKEKRIIAELELLFGEIIAPFKLSNIEKDECDVYLSKYKIVIEIDGYKWHKNKLEVDKKKSERIIQCGFKLIRVRDLRFEQLDKSLLIPFIHVLYYSEKEEDLTVCKRLVSMIYNIITGEKLIENVSDKNDL